MKISNDKFNQFARSINCKNQYHEFKQKKKTEQNRTQLWLMKVEIQYLSHEFRAKQDETERVKFGQHLTVN